MKNWRYEKNGDKDEISTSPNYKWYNYKKDYNKGMSGNNYIINLFQLFLLYNPAQIYKVPISLWLQEQNHFFHITLFIYDPR